LVLPTPGTAIETADLFEWELHLLLARGGPAEGQEENAGSEEKKPPEPHFELTDLLHYEGADHDLVTMLVPNLRRPTIHRGLVPWGPTLSANGKLVMSVANEVPNRLESVLDVRYVECEHFVPHADD
tara:strand:+ start:218 stop:598 length:381 start_codon:yes stop_codon:yes gene_type:complete